MAKMFDTKTRARTYCSNKNKKARTFKHVYQKYGGGYVVYKVKKGEKRKAI